MTDLQGLYAIAGTTTRPTTAATATTSGAEATTTTWSTYLMQRSKSGWRISLAPGFKPLKKAPQDSFFPIGKLRTRGRGASRSREGGHHPSTAKASWRRRRRPQRGLTLAPSSRGKRGEREREKREEREERGERREREEREESERKERREERGAGGGLMRQS